MKDPKQIVREGYDNLTNRYRDHYSFSHHHEYKTWIANFKSSIQAGDPILELGCGDGIPVAQLLSVNYDYTGIDISPVQIRNANRQVPDGTFLDADMTEIEFPAESFSGIIALYSIIHVPVEEQQGLLQKIYTWLRANGIFLCTVGGEEFTGVEKDWIVPGTTMYWSHMHADKYSEWFMSIGFTVIKREYIPEQMGGHTLFWLKKG